MNAPADEYFRLYSRGIFTGRLLFAYVLRASSSSQRV